ncbi:MAG: type II toxin-antitoxin system HicA family toxin [Magnetococcales bacterium]|nr:type II toxin-antitoxin system HicA family toxin [Magnetococcales bacterium]
MGRHSKTFWRILGGRSDANLAFSDLRGVLLHLGFIERIRGSHFIFHHEGMEEILNLQTFGDKAKPYQVKQVRNLLLKYKLGTNDDISL